MNSAQSLALLRQFFVLFGGVAGTWLVSKGYVSETQWSSLTGAFGSIASIVLTTLMPIGISVWASLHAHSDHGLVASAEKVPDVAAIDMKPTDKGTAIAAATSDKVTVVGARRG